MLFAYLSLHLIMKECLVYRYIWAYWKWGQKITIYVCVLLYVYLFHSFKTTR